MDRRHLQNSGIQSQCPETQLVSPAAPAPTASVYPGLSSVHLDERAFGVFRPGPWIISLGPPSRRCVPWKSLRRTLLQSQCTLLRHGECHHPRDLPHMRNNLQQGDVVELPDRFVVCIHVSTNLPSPKMIRSLRLEHKWIILATCPHKAGQGTSFKRQTKNSKSGIQRQLLAGRLGLV